MSGRRRERRFRWAGLLGKALLDALFFTVRFRTHGTAPVEACRDAGRPLLFVFWHGTLLPLVYLHRRQGVVVLVSEHADGEYITRIIQRYGFATARGSSSRGAVRGLKALIRAGRAGSDLAVTPDGPRGPARIFKPGALLAARAAGVPVVTVAVGVSRAWRLGSWDGFLVPKPFSVVSVRYGDPVPVPSYASDDELEALAGRLQAQLLDSAERAHREATGRSGVDDG